MGLAASSARLLSLISRQHDNNLQLLNLSRTKVSLANETTAAAKEYQNALSSKKMQWSNGGMNSVDLSYGLLMRPNANNMKNAAYITGSDGKIIVDSKYRKYAEMISPNGLSLGNYDGDTRIAILSELTGIPAEDIENADSTSAIRNRAETIFSEEESAFDEWLDIEDKTRGAGTKYLTVDEYAEKIGTINNNDLSKLYKQNGEFYFDNIGELKTYIDGIKTTLGKYFVDDELIGCTDKTKFSSACDQAYNMYADAIKNGEIKKDKEFSGLWLKNNGYKINVQDMFKQIMTNFATLGGTSKTQSTNANEKTYPLRNTSSVSYQNWYKELQNRYNALVQASDVYESTNETANMAMTADQEAIIQYYDNLFTAIADNGWTYDAQVSDSDYINQMFQNNTYCLTTMTKNTCYDSDFDDNGRNWKYDYDTSLASTFDNIITVNDSEAASKALAKYEAEKLKINQKETRIDTKMKDLETEQAAIEQMIESIKKQKNDNIDRTFKLWS